MIPIFNTLIGFLAPFIPEVIKLFIRRQENAHELAVLRLQMEKGNAEHLWKMDEINAQADIAEAQALRQPQQSFGVQILDRARESLPVWMWLPVFWLFALLDFVVGMVRPTIAYAAFGFYMAYRWACVSLMLDVAPDMSGAEAIAKVYNENDFGVLLLVLSYWFGERTRNAVFGGSASTAHAGR